MSNQAFGNLVVPAAADVAALSDSLEQSGAETGGGGLNFLEFKAKLDTWQYGRENARVNDAVILVHPGGFKHGFIGFNKMKKPTKVIKPVGQYIDPNSLPAVDFPDGKGWADAFGLTAVFLDEDIQGVLVEYCPSTYGGVQAAKELAGKVGAQMKVDAAHAFAVVQLGSDSYTHPEYGLTGTPVLELLGWADADGNGADGNPVLALDAPAAKEPEPKPEPAPERAAAPAANATRRRRRASA